MRLVKSFLIPLLLLFYEMFYLLLCRLLSRQLTNFAFFAIIYKVKMLFLAVFRSRKRSYKFLFRIFIRILGYVRKFVR